MNRVSVMDEIKKFLAFCNISFEGNQLIQTLETLGVKTVEDLQDVREQDLIESGLTLIEQRRLLRSIKERFSAVPNKQIQQTSPVQPNVSQPLKKSQQPQRSQVSYILCQRMFTRSVQKEVISNLNLDVEPLELLVNIISEREKYPLDTYALEFYSQEGYPLCVNDYNQKFTLSQWKIANFDLIYVFVRPKEQPDWTVDGEGAEAISPTTGTDRIRIYSQLYQTFIINVDLKNVSKETLVRKVATYTGLPSSNIKLYKQEATFQEIVNGDLELTDNECLILRIEPFADPQIDFGKSTYIPMQLQTDRGYSKFYAILKYLIHSSTIDSKAFVANILQFTCCPPLAYAFHQLFQQKSILHLSHIVVLFEGFYQLCSAFLQYFCNVEGEKCFEFCDYIFGLMIKLSNSVTAKDKVEMDKLLQHCPISGRQILNPVQLPQSEFIYERNCVEYNLKEKLSIPNCTCDDLQLGDIRPAPKYERLLMYNAFNNVDDFDVWKVDPPVQSTLSPIIISCTWKDVDESLNLLCIKAPDALAAMKYCLTYIKDGQLVCYTEPSKAAESQLLVYDPLKQEDCAFKKSDMETFSSQEKDKVCHKITDYLKPKIKAGLPESVETSSITAIGVKQGLTEIRETPEEAIMVLIDCSGSMSRPMYESESRSQSSVYSKLTAAKDFFFAFANRTDAYGFAHVIGLITFETKVTVQVMFTPVMDYFKDIVSNIRTAAQTALYDAIIEAVDKLKQFTTKYPSCHRRILCLTDGSDNCSKTTAHEVTRVLQREKIAVDTILIAHRGNLDQKAISHATGGFCFLPSTLPQAMRLFEMESLLSIRDRFDPYPQRNLVSSKRDLDVFKSTSQYPYDSTDPYDFKSKFSADLDQMQSCSAKKLVQLATFMGGSPGVGSAKEKSNVRRVVLEARNYLRSPHPDVEIFPSQSNACLWKILLKGPASTPYVGGVFLLCAKFSDDYPFKPPEIRFVTPIYHCNINSSGRICHPILGRNYIPSMTMRQIIDNIYGLLMAPEPLDPLDSLLASQYHDSRAVYETKASELTEKYAKLHSWDELKGELAKDEDTDVSDGLVCPLTRKLFVEPVLTAYGHTYEKSALLEYMAKNGNRDPQANKPIREEDLIPQRAIKKLADDFRKSNLLK